MALGMVGALQRGPWNDRISGLGGTPGFVMPPGPGLYWAALEREWGGWEAAMGHRWSHFSYMKCLRSRACFSVPMRLRCASGFRGLGSRAGDEDDQCSCGKQSADLGKASRGGRTGCLQGTPHSRVNTSGGQQPRSDSLEPQLGGRKGAALGKEGSKLRVWKESS